MTTNAYTEEEFKKLLKTLFAEKKRVKELQKQLDEKGVHKKFQTKLTDIHKLSIAEEYATLKSAYLDKEKESADLKEKLEKVRPALRKLVEELKAARGEIEALKKEVPSMDQALQEKLETANERIAALEKEKTQLTEEHEEARTFRERALALEEELSTQKECYASLVAEKKIFDTTIEEFKIRLEEKSKEIERAQTNEQKEAKRFEAERSRLVERLAEVLSQVQRKTEIIKDLKEEISSLHRICESGETKLKQYEEQIAELKYQQKESIHIAEENTALKQRLAKIEEEIGREREAFAFQTQEWAQREKHLHEITAQLEEAHKQLQESDLTTIHEKYEKQMQQVIDEMTAGHEAAVAQLNEQIAEGRTEHNRAKSENAALHEQFQEVFEEKEKALEKAYSKMRELSSRHGGMVEELEKISQQLEEKQQYCSRKEKEWASAHSYMQNAKHQCEERDVEIRKAQQHLAKKVKETTLLRDLNERQNEQLSELREALNKQSNELERMQNSINLQHMHEEKLQAMAKESIEAGETLAKEWQEKYMALQQDWREQKTQLTALHKMREEYDHMAATVSNLKNILGKSEEH